MISDSSFHWIEDKARTRDVRGTDVRGTLPKAITGTGRL